MQKMQIFYGAETFKELFNLLVCHRLAKFVEKEGSVDFGFFDTKWTVIENAVWGRSESSFGIGDSLIGFKNSGQTGKLPERRKRHTPLHLQQTE
jgi:hypothetical protein